MIREYSHAAPRYLSDLLRSGTPSALSDSELLSRFAARRSEHDEAAELAFAALLARHGPMVLRVCRAVLVDRQDVEDAFQATFLVLAIRRGRFVGMARWHPGCTGWRSRGGFGAIACGTETAARAQEGCEFLIHDRS